MANRKKGNNEGLIIQQIDIRSIDRSSQDIRKWRDAIKTAESVFNPTRKGLYDLYHDILLDGHLTSVIEKRLTAITNSPLVFVDKNGKEVDKINNMIETEEFDEILTEILNAKFWGFTLLELNFTPDKIIPTLIDRRHVKPELSIVTRTPYELEGLKYKEPPYDRYVLTAGKTKDLGMLMKAAQYVIYKRGDFGDWAQYAELFGMPFRKGKYDGYDEASRLKLENALKEAGSAAYAVIPEGTDIEFISNNSTGNGELYKHLRDACNEEISTLVVGQTLTTNQGDKGARSLGEVHMEVQGSIHLADKMYIEKNLNGRLLPLLKLHGYPVQGGYFSYPEVDSLTKKEKIDIILRVKKEGHVPVDDDQIYEITGINKPDNYEQLKKEQEERRKALVKPPTGPPQDKNDTKNWWRVPFNYFSH